MILRKSKKGRNPELVRPYRQRTCELGSSPRWARDMGSDLDPKEHGLKPVHCRDVACLVHI
ncbi:hypothetical protein [Sinisalibacter aestuarii]|uniref:Uncharacterized protein n=1 Tax=Sinisalibacter aestuarii TaxID=2949426 RepID=A0ABQ5LXB1_9RHOB|nr:hypothetical protein [Sinisalibacter aestuarii]GKY89253.1 hypothetical protein STA1M1_31220 [Sinisalibacter aestuarii]